jgi:hypothetical protein
MAAVVAALTFSTQALAKSPLCAPPTSSTGTTSMNSNRILKAVGGNYGGPMGLTADQRRGISSALSGYNSLGYALGNGGTVAISRHTFDGLGLTDAQHTAIWRYISGNVNAERTKNQTSCKPFKNPKLVQERIRKLLIYNGFRPAMSFHLDYTGYMTVDAIQDGIRYVGIITKIGARSVWLDFTRNVQSGDAVKVPLTFEA